MIDGLDRSNETVAKYLHEYHHFATELPLESRIELISDLVRYQDSYAKVHKFQTQQRKPWSKKQKRDYYMAVIKSNLGWKVKDFRGMTFEEIEAKFTIVWKQLEDFVPMGSKEEAERLKRKGLSLEQESVKKLKTLEKSPRKQSLLMKFLKKREDLNQLWALVKESLNNRQPTSDKEMELWVELKRNKEMNDFCSKKGIKREFSNAKTPQQNGVAERRNRTLIEAARTMLADAKLPTPNELFNGRTPDIGFLKPFGCHVMILNTLDNLEKFKAKGDEGTKDAASQEGKKDVSSLRYIALPNWVHDALLESSSSKPQDGCSSNVPESSRNTNSTATPTNPPADQLETLKVETSIPTVSSPVPTASFTDSPEPSRVTTNSVDSDGVEADVLKNKKDERGIVIKNKARLVAQGHTQEEGINYDEVFTPVAKIKAIKLFLAYASFMGFTVYQMDGNSSFLYGTIDEEVNTIMERHQFYDYHNMIAILEKSEHNVDFHPIVDFVEASPLRTGTESSLRRNLKLHDEEGINEPASPLRDVNKGEAFPTDSGFKVDQDRANITKTSTLPHDSAPRVTSPAADEGKDREGLAVERSGDDAPIKGRNLDEGEASAERLSDATEEMATVLTSMDATSVLASGVAKVPTGSGSIPIASPPAAEVPTGSDVVPTAGLIFITATVVTPYTRRKGKETMVEFTTPKKKKIQEKMDIQMARQLAEEMERDAQRMNEQIARDAEIARIYAEEELQIMIDGLDRSNEIVAKYLQEYHHFATELPLERRIELLSNLVRLESEDFRGMKFEEFKAKFTTLWKQLEDFVPMGSKEEAKRLKRKGLSLEQESVKKLKTSEEVPKEAKSPDEVPEEKVKVRMQLVPIEEIYVEAL
nr:ribonuclease H-like domain-containing protein [Tanacetum cinerariifolium]